jgi:hypothetical protein
MRDRVVDVKKGLGLRELGNRWALAWSESCFVFPDTFSHAPI